MTVSKAFHYILSIYIMVILGSSCNSGTGDYEEIETSAPADSVNKRAENPVEIVIAESKDFDYLIQANGKIKSLSEQQVTAENNGRLVSSKAKPGTTFSPGSIIAQMEVIPIQLRMARAKLNQFNAQKEFESQLLGYRNLLKANDTAQASSIRKKLRISSGLSGADQDIKEAEYDLSKSSIRAPFSCRVSDVKVNQGEYIKAGQNMFRLYDPSNLVLEIKVMEVDFALLKKNTKATIQPISEPDKKYNAFVYDINPYIDENGMALIRLKLSNESLLFPGMNCTATISLPTGKSINVPKNSVVIRNGKPVVFTAEKGQAKWHYVTIGRDNGKYIEIKEGITIGEKVITTNNLQLSDNAPVVLATVTNTIKNQIK